MLTFTQNQIAPEIAYFPKKLSKKRAWWPAIQISLPILGLYPIVKVWLVPLTNDQQVTYQAVYHAKGWSGLSLRPRLNEVEGIEEWYIHYDCAEKILAGPFDFIRDARHLTTLLARFNWTRPANEFSRREIDEIKKIITEYMREITWINEIEIEVLQEFFQNGKNGRIGCGDEVTRRATA